MDLLGLFFLISAFVSAAYIVRKTRGNNCLTVILLVFVFVIWAIAIYLRLGGTFHA